MEPTDEVEFGIWRQDAIVLLAWLEWVDLKTVPHQHRAELQALVDLLTELDQTIAVPTDEHIAAAREEVARDMDWA